MKSDEELLTSFKYSIGEGNIITLEFLEAELETQNSIRQAELVVEGLTRLLKEAPDKNYKLLIDITIIRVFTHMPARAKDIYSTALIFKRMSKTAVISSTLFMKILTSAISFTSGKYETTKSFNSKEEALDWLNSTK